MQTYAVEAEHVFGTFPSGEPDYYYYDDEKCINDVTKDVLPLLLSEKLCPAKVVNDPFFPDSVWCYVDVLQREVRVDYKTSISLDANFESTEERTPTRVVLLDPLPEEDDRLNNRTHVVLTPKAPFESWKTLEQLRTEGPVLNTFNGKRCNRPRRPCQ